MKTARFSQVVKNCGEPEIHLALVDPAKDRELQRAVKAHRVMTVHQTMTGNKTDHGEVGLAPGPNRQYLIFPKSLRAHEGKSIVGIKYELLETKEIPKSQRAAPAKPPRKPRSTAKGETPPVPERRPKAKASSPAKIQKPKQEQSSKIVAFRAAEEEDSDEEIAELRAQVRKAMALLEDGKQVAAFNVLKRIASR